MNRLLILSLLVGCATTNGSTTKSKNTRLVSCSDEHMQDCKAEAVYKDLSVCTISLSALKKKNNRFWICQIPKES